MAPRYSIIPGDFVEDERADANHFRVLTLLGRKSDKHGWVTYGNQSRMADDLGITRETVNRKLKDLVDWGYVEKRSQSDTHRSLCHYRVLMDRHGPPPIDAPDGDGEDESHAESGQQEQPKQGCDPPLTPPSETWGCDAELTRGGVTPGITRGVISGVTPVYDPQYTTPEESPPTPRRRGGREIEDWIRRIRAAVDDRVVDQLLEPLIRSRKIDAPDPGFALISLAKADRFENLDDQALRDALQSLLRERKQTVKPSDVQTAARVERPRSEARAQHAAAQAYAERANPELAALWQKILAQISARYGPDIVEAWFGGVIPDRLDAGVLHLAAKPMVARYIGQHFVGETRFEQSLAAVDPSIISVEVRSAVGGPT